MAGQVDAVVLVTMAYTSKELSIELGLPERTVSTWADRQLLHPSIAETRGKGSRLLWSENDLKRGRLLKQLVPLLRPELVREIANQFKKD